MKKYFLFLVWLPICLIAAVASAESSKMVVVTGEASVANITPEEAKGLALRRARQNAIEKVCGVRLQAETFLHNFSLQGDFIHTVSYGKIVSEEILRWDMDVIQKSRKQVPGMVYRVTLKAYVKQEQGEADPYYNVRIKLNKKIYQAGDEMILKIRATKPSYITVLNFSADDRVTLLFPNRIRRGNFIQANRQIQFPSEEDRENVLKLQVYNLPGHAKNTEIIKVIATREPIYFFENLDTEGDYGVADTSRLAVTEIARLISSISLKSRAEATAIYEIVSGY